VEIFPKSVVELDRMFPDEEACRVYLERLRWPGGFECPHCHARNGWRASRGRLVCHECRYQGTVTAGTIFQDTRKPLRLWFHAIWQVVSQKNGASARSVQASLGLASYKTAWTWLHKLRRAMVLPGRALLSGEVEVDETFVGGPHPDRLGRFENKQTVMVAAERKGSAIGRIRLACVPNTTRKSLHDFVRQHVAVGSVVHTDGRTAYQGLGQSYLHQPITLLHQEKNAASRLLPHVHRVASLLKRWLLGTHQGRIGETQLPYYLDEFTFRFNRRKAHTPGKLFHALLHQALREEPAPYADLIAKDPQTTTGGG
jgi:transposase-like protein